jgi:hypothetical protein
MPLRWGAANSNTVTCGNPQTAPTIFTAIALLTVTASTGNKRISGKGGTNGFWNFSAPDFFGTNTLSVGVDYATTDANARSADNAFALNVPFWAVASFDGTNAPRLFHGNVGQPILEASYVAQNAPAGARAAETVSTLHIGNQPSATTASLNGSMWFYGWWPVAMTLGDAQHAIANLKDYQRAALVFLYPGENGTSRVVDLSGKGNHGTISGPVQSGQLIGWPPAATPDTSAAPWASKLLTV